MIEDADYITFVKPLVEALYKLQEEQSKKVEETKYAKDWIIRN
jgi:hypothetical protein